MRYFFEGPSGKTKDRFEHRANEESWCFKIGEGFDDYDFTKTCPSFKQCIIDRLEQLRSSRKYLRLWFSGGKDSRLILDTSRKIGIEFDEIVISKIQMPGSMFKIGALTEIQYLGVDYIESIKDSFKKTKITIVDFEDRDFELVYSNKEWYRHTTCWYIHTAIEPNLFYRYANPVNKMFDDINDRIDIMGCVQPHVYWENGWKFVFVDTQFTQNLWDTCQNFLVDPDHPEICLSYVKSLIKELEKRKLKPKRFQTDLFAKSNQNLRSIKDLVPEYQFDIHRPDAEVPKRYADSWRPSNELFWKANPTFKSTLTCLMCYYGRPMPRAFSLYKDNQDWDKIIKEIDNGGILSKEYVC